MVERTCSQQSLIAAPVEEIWALVGDPNRHPEWWPRILASDCDEIGPGCSYRTVLKGPFGKEEHEMLLERFDDCREVLIRCVEVGVWQRWAFTEARGGTFVEVEFGIEPATLADKAFAATLGRRFMRRWAEQSLDGLREAAESPALSSA